MKPIARSEHPNSRRRHTRAVSQTDSAPQTARKPRSARRKCIALCSLSDCLLQAYESVASRAYDKFLKGGARQGGELEDWLNAERELLLPIQVDFEESEDFVYAMAHAPGFAGADVEVGIEAGWLSILASRESEEETDAAQGFCILPLPAEVDPDRSIAVLGDGLLGIRMPKAVEPPENDSADSSAGPAAL